MVPHVSLKLARLLLAGAALTVAASAAAQSTPQTEQPGSGGGLILPGTVQSTPSGSTAAGTITQRPQQAPAAQQPRPAAQPQQQPRPAPQAQAQRAPSKPPEKTGVPQGTWDIAPDVYSDGSFKLCAAENRFDNNLILIMLQGPNKKTNLMIGAPGAQMPPGARFKAQIKIDSKLDKEINGAVVAPELVALNTGQEEEIARGIGTGNVLTVMLPGQGVAFQLKGTSKALSDLSACVDQAAAGTLKLPPPPPAMPPQLAKLLLDAGLKDARALPVDKMPPEQRPGDFAWQIGQKVLGAIRNFPIREEAGDLAKISQTYVDSLAKTCQGTFTPTLGTVETVKQVTFRTGSALCEMKEGKVFVSLVMYLSAQRTLGVFSHEAMESERATAETASAGILKALKEAAAKEPPAQQGQAAPQQPAPQPKK
ncbi:hypothetical protein [Rhodospirillum centenum]|uniref:Uncharacterized protein n=1 Tax=Rhodospirillum centenum (strain ATCC 51521 / SW) TaxID=414684 RepID=B6IR72_RHOCS|nr:hypothetical protein [Rhodospirillum centenum]ACI97958.1 hypothetical protein RC1_0521 [Rhodospirillum centenum SW]